jgi:hypothetical protein
MGCENCTAKELTGLALETSEVCAGPVDGELVVDGELLASFRGVCHALIAARIMKNEYRPGQLNLHPAEGLGDTSVDLTAKIIEFPRSA